LEYLDISEIPLTTLPANGFSSMSIKKVILPKNLQVIPQSLFKNCKQLEEVTIPSGVTEIKGGYEDNKCFGAFYNCKALKSINIPAGIEVLESGTFAYCENLETVTFAKNSKLNTIADGGSYTDSSSWPYKNYYYGVFSCCTSLTAIDFPNGLKTIGVYAFANARLPKLVFPASVETIEYAAFRGCRGISSISFAAGSVLKTIKSSAFTRDYDDNLVFWSLKTVDMSACTQIESIGSMAFSENESLELFKIGTITPPTCESDAFSEIKSFSILKVPSESVAAYKQATGWKEFANISALD
ncbi:leucine-rich repeat protein, partial [Alistipes dispar]|uniref:leucine-rich repeat domain-containing protein n=1 Tax=Alistipes dispar TaxID=2585119 RepID=UPI003A94EB1D